MPLYTAGQGAVINAKKLFGRESAHDLQSYPKAVHSGGHDPSGVTGTLSAREKIVKTQRIHFFASLSTFYLYFIYNLPKFFPKIIVFHFLVLIIMKYIFLFYLL